MVASATVRGGARDEDCDWAVAEDRTGAAHQRLSDPLEQAGVARFGQHVDKMDVSNLIDIFRAERDTCLLDADAVRDGVDAPGDSLRLIVFDRALWPRPDILHKVRKSAFFRGAL